MKASKIKGYIVDLENRNKNFSFDKTMKILDISNFIYVDLINNFDYKEVSEYRNAKYLIKEISEEFNTLYEMIDNGKILMSVCLLRNVYEEIIYIMASSIKQNCDINVMTKAGYYNNIVAENCNQLLSDLFEPGDIKAIYGYLSKITHVTNIKEAASYLVGNKKIKKYIANEMKYMILLIENIYLDFLNKKNKIDSSMCNNILALSGYVELINTIYFVANSTKANKKIEPYFYGNKNQKYLNEQKELMIETFKDYNKSKNELSKSINGIAKKLDEQLEKNKYLEMAKTILNS